MGLSDENRALLNAHGFMTGGLEEIETSFEALLNAAREQGRTPPVLLPAVCFTCGADAHKIIWLPAGCAALPGARGYVAICPQHEISIEPIEPYHEIAEATLAGPRSLFPRTPPVQLAVDGDRREQVIEVLLDYLVFAAIRDHYDETPDPRVFVEEVADALFTYGLIADEPAPRSGGDETGWLIEETWTGHVHYVHRDFDAEEWRKETDRVHELSRRKQPFITKDANEAMTFDTKDRAEAWMNAQPIWMRLSNQYQVREHMWSSPQPVQARGGEREAVARIIYDGEPPGRYDSASSHERWQSALYTADTILAALPVQGVGE